MISHLLPLLFRKGAWCCSAIWQEWMSQLMPGEFLQQFLRVIGKDRQDVLTPPGWPQWRTTYHITTSVWKMPPSWHWIGHSGGYWQQVELRTKLAHDVIIVKFVIRFNLEVALVLRHCDWLMIDWLIDKTESGINLLQMAISRSELKAEERRQHVEHHRYQGNARQHVTWPETATSETSDEYA